MISLLKVTAQIICFVMYMICVQSRHAIDFKNEIDNYLNLDAKVCDALFWNYLSTLLIKYDTDTLNEADEHIIEFVKKMFKEKSELLAYKPPTVYWYSRQG